MVRPRHWQALKKNKVSRDWNSSYLFTVGSSVSPYMTNASRGEPDDKYVCMNCIPKTFSYRLTRKIR